MKWSRTVVAIALVATACAGCRDAPSGAADTGSAADGTMPPLCMPGRVAACPCDDGRAGRQKCETDGVWGDCQCEDATEKRDTGASALDSGPIPEDTGQPSDTTTPDTGRDTREAGQDTRKAGRDTRESGDIQRGGPPDPDAWQVVFRDDFENGALDTAKWSIGFGWGKTTTGSPEVIRASQVEVRDGALRLSATHEHDGDIYAGAVNTKNKRTYGPGTYWEARINPPKRTGFLPAFWAKPNSEAWPPEIDFMELFQADYRNAKAWTNPHYNIHYSHAGCGSGSDNATPIDHDSGMDVTRDYHVYGAKWLQDKVEFYFDGQKVGDVTNATAIQQMNNCSPFYMMLNIHVDKVGTTDKSEPWTETMDVDWVRVWGAN